MPHYPWMKWIDNARERLLISLFASVLGFLLSYQFSIAVRLFIAWDAFVFVMITLSWIIILSTTPKQTRARAEAEDPGRKGVFLIVIFTGLIALAAALVLLRVPPKGMSQEEMPILDALVVGAIFGGWILTHTVYVFHYAHLYYLNTKKSTKKLAIEFPGEDNPDDLDFAYLSFTVGMTFQVSDIDIPDRLIRRTILWHGLQSFLFNTAILAVSLNGFAGILTKS